MANLNKVFLIGNLTHNPDLRQTTGGSAVCTLRMAVNRRYTTQRGENRDETLFIDVTVWGKQAEACSQYLSKGRPLFVEGRLRQDTWTTNDGQNRSKIKVTAERVQFLGAGTGATDAEPSKPAAPEQSATEPGEQDDEIPF